MRISSVFNPVNKTKNNKISNYVSYPNLKPLMCDTISFGAMKKSQFKGIDLAVINKYKAPIEKFNSQSDLDDWCNEKINKLREQKYPARQDEATIQRKAMLKEWFDYVIEENDAYTPSIQLLILDEITKNLKKDNDVIPLVLNKGILAETIYQIQKGIKENKSYEQGQINFNKLYQLNLQKFYTEDLKEVSNESGEYKGKTGWVVIPSKENDPENFENNVDKLKALSHPAWCTKSFNAKPYLSKGDFHVYLENGKPKLGVRFEGDKIQEIQGELNNTRIPLKYLPTVEKHIALNNLPLTEDAVFEIERAHNGCKQVQEIAKRAAEAIKNKDWVTILNYPEFNCGARYLDDGSIEVDNYNFNTDFMFSDLGIDENELFDRIVKVNGALDLNFTTVDSLKNLKEVGGDVNIEYSRLKNTGSLEKIGGNFNFSSLKTEIENQKLRKIAGKILDIENLYTQYDVEQILVCNRLLGTKGDKEAIFKILGIKFKKLEDGTYKISEYTPEQIEYNNKLMKQLNMTEDELLDNVSVVVGDVILEDSRLKSLGTIQKIGGNLKLSHSKLEDLGKLNYVRGSVEIGGNNNIESLGNVTRIDGNLEAQNNKSLKSLGNLQVVKGNCNISNTPIQRTRYLRVVGGDFSIAGSNITKLDYLKQVDGKIYLDSYLAEILDSQLWENGLWANSEIVSW